MNPDTLANLFATMLTGLPNLAVALWMLRAQDQRINTLLESQRWLIQQLMALHPPQDSPTPPPGTLKA